jgi:hypothetical protein
MKNDDPLGLKDLRTRLKRMELWIFLALAIAGVCAIRSVVSGVLSKTEHVTARAFSAPKK